MAEEPNGDKGIHRIIPSKGDSPHKRREKIIVLGTIALVILTILLLRRGSNSTPSTSDEDDYEGDNGVSGNSYDPDSDYADDSGGVGTPATSTAATDPTTPAATNTGATTIANLRKKLAKQTTLANTRKRIVGGQHRTIVSQRKTLNTFENHAATVHHPAHKGKKNANTGITRKPAHPAGTIAGNGKGTYHPR